MGLVPAMTSSKQGLRLAPLRIWSSPKAKDWTCCIENCWRQNKDEDKECKICEHPRCSNCRIVEYNSELSHDRLVMSALRVTTMHLVYECGGGEQVMSFSQRPVHCPQMFGDPDYWYCCLCGYGPQSVHLSPSCCSCGHDGCSNCTRE